MARAPRGDDVTPRDDQAMPPPAGDATATGTPHLGTLAIHGGQHPDPLTGAVSVPIYQTSTFHQPALGEDHGYTYARAHNPTREALERNLAALEGATHCVAFGSGMAAIHAVTALLDAGDHVVASSDMYGGTYRVFEAVMRRLGIGFSYVDTTDPERIAAAVGPSTRMLYIETPSNPLMHVTDLRRVAELGRARRLTTVCDNTFMSPCFQRPLEHGIDVVVHSTTKYLNGHSDAIGGAVLVQGDRLAERLRLVRNATGGIPGPFDCWLVLRGLKTLAVRMQRHADNAGSIARLLESHPEVGRVNYPGLPSHPGHALMQRQCSAAGGMISIDLGDLERARRVLGACRLFTLAESLGGVESLISHPATMTHAFLDEGERARIGIGPGLVRLSVGIEDVRDLAADLQQALATLA
jgi:cystathionine beta-lyase/cystathionine gamma-synthase